MWVCLHFYRNSNNICICHQLFQNNKSATCFPCFIPVVSRPTVLFIALRLEYCVYYCWGVHLDWAMSHIIRQKKYVKKHSYTSNQWQDRQSDTGCMTRHAGWFGLCPLFSQAVQVWLADGQFEPRHCFTLWPRKHTPTLGNSLLHARRWKKSQCPPV